MIKVWPVIYIFATVDLRKACYYFASISVTNKFFVIFMIIISHKEILMRLEIIKRLKTVAITDDNNIT